MLQVLAGSNFIFVVPLSSTYLSRVHILQVEFCGRMMHQLHGVMKLHIPEMQAAKTRHVAIAGQ
jgi:hypothetical protein